MARKEWIICQKCGVKIRVDIDSLKPGVPFTCAYWCNSNHSARLSEIVRSHG